MGILNRKKPTTKKPTVKKATTVEAKVRKAYDEGKNYNDLAEEYRLTVPEVEAIVEAK